jgi:hypothetical protein
MLKSSLIAAAVAAIWAGGLVLSSTAASAQGMRADMSCTVDGCPHSNNSWYSNDGGLGRYCPPGYYPHSFPGGNGIRCEAPDTGSSLRGY